MHLQISSYLLLQGRPLFIGLFHFFFQFARINARGGRAHQFLAALGQCGHQFLQRIHSIRHKALKRLRIYTLYTSRCTGNTAPKYQVRIKRVLP